MGLRLALVVLIGMSVYQLLAPSTYRIPLGSATIRMAPTVQGGATVLPLGPVGSVSFDTHDTPFDLTVDFVFDADAGIADETEALLRDLPGVAPSATDALRSFAIGKIPWVVALGLAAGLLVAGIGRLRWRRLLIGAGAGLVLVTGIVGGLAYATYTTLDRRPSVTYDGLAQYVPRVVTLLQGVIQQPEAAEWSVDDLARGLEEVARQATTAWPVAGEEEVVRLLVAGDLHDNVVGYRLVRRLAADDRLAVAGVVLVGDLVHVGTAAEAELVLRELEPVEVPIMMVGGNHEDAPAMRAFREAGIVQLADGPVELAGLTITGFDDPLAGSFAALTDVERRKAAAEEALKVVQAEAPTPDVAVFHDVGQAESVISWARDQELPLTVMHGHDHVASVEREGSVVILDPGSGGASGFEQLGRDPGTPYEFQLAEFTIGEETAPFAVVTLRYEGLAGTSSAEYRSLVPTE